MATSTIQGVKLFVENIWKFLKATKHWQNNMLINVDQQYTAVLSYSVTELCPELITADFHIKKNQQDIEVMSKRA